MHPNSILLGMKQEDDPPRTPMEWQQAAIRQAGPTSLNVIQLPG